MLSGAPADVEIAALIHYGLAGYAVAQSKAAGLSVDQRLQAARIASAARHLVAKRKLTGLVEGWAASGIEAMLFKGFALAEFDYPEASWRPYSDVDVAIRGAPGTGVSGLTATAAEVAASLGFSVLGRPDVSTTFDSLYGESYNGPALLQIFDTSGSLVVDVHSRIVHNSHDESRKISKASAITNAVWQRSQTVKLDSAPVRVPTPVDSAVVGLILSRSWSTDASRLRPHDYLDLEVLSHHGVDRRAIEARASELGCTATVRLFLSRCDPERGRLDLRPPNALTRLHFDTVHAPERGHRTLAVRRHEARHLPSRTRATIAQLPNARRHLRLWRQRPPAIWPAEALAEGSAELDRESWRLTQFGLRRAFQLSGLRHPERHEDLALASLLFALRSRGVPVVRSRHGDEDRLVLHGERLRPTVLGIRRPDG